MQLVVGVSVRCCQIVVRSLSDRCRCVLSCSRSVLLVPESEFSPGCSVSDSLSLTRAVAGAARGWCFCAVLSDRCQIVVRSLLLVSCLVLGQSS